MMKNKLSLYFMLSIACLVCQSCLFKENDIFDDSSANRATSDVQKCEELLTSYVNGWLMAYYYGIDYRYGGINLLCKFDGKEVTMASQGYDGDETITSLYQVKSEESTMITFDSYNLYIHRFCEPLGGTTNPNANNEGDYEFIVSEYSAERIVLRGKKYGNIIVMTPMSTEVSWKGFMNSVNKIDQAAKNGRYQICIDGAVIGTVSRNDNTFAITYTQNEEIIMLSNESFIFNATGFSLRKAIIIDGRTIKGATDVTLV